MAAGPSGPLTRQFDRLWNSGTDPGLDDAELLKRFRESEGQVAEQAFEVLLDRHGPMVLGVCRQLLGRTADADDAFQATFLILVRKARSIRVNSSLAPWLYAVAYRTAIRARAVASRRVMAEMPDQGVAGESTDGSFAWEVRPMIHEELERLPEKYRAPIVLCHLEGKSHEEAARVLRWPVGTVSGRLSRGRQLLKARLERRGLTVSPGVLAARLPADTTSLPAQGLLTSTARAASDRGNGHVFSASVHSLSQGVLRTMLLNKMRTAGALILSLGAISGGLAAVAGRTPAAEKKPSAQQASPPQGPSSNLIGQLTGSGPAPTSGYLPNPIPGTSTFDPNPFAGMRNQVNVVDAGHPFPILRNGNVMVVETADGAGWTAMAKGLEGRNPLSGRWEWNELRHPAGMRPVPLMAGDTIALVYKGKRIEEVAAFSGKTGKWSKQRLREPARDDLVPIVADEYALYQAGTAFYAFSTASGRWDVLGLTGADRPKVDLHGGDVLVLQGNKLYVFDVLVGRWSPAVTIKLPGKDVPGVEQ